MKIEKSILQVNKRTAKATTTKNAQNKQINVLLIIYFFQKNK